MENPIERSEITVEDMAKILIELVELGHSRKILKDLLGDKIQVVKITPDCVELG